MKTENQQAVTRRLLLAKELYLHALEHSEQAGALNKMIAIHNLHNAVEVVLRAVAMHYEIRTERELNIDFETMLNEIDRAPCFAQEGKRLPYRSELRKLNAIRNLVQHHAHEPEASTMEEWRVFSRRFLVRSLKAYFEVDFEQLSTLSFIDDDRIRGLLTLSERYLNEKKWAYAAGVDKAIFQFVQSEVVGRPSQSSRIAFLSSNMKRATGSYEAGRVLERTIEEILERVGAVENYTALVSSGVSLRDYARMRKVHVAVHIVMSGKAMFQLLGEVAEKDARWLHNFVTRTVIKWQSTGLEPSVPDRLHAGCDELIANGINEDGA